MVLNGRYQALPKLGVATESKKNLADLKLTILALLEAASSVSRKDLFERIDFVISDQTAHNFEVEHLISDQLESGHIPSHLFCNVHPSLMFNRVMTKIWGKIENAIGKEKIYSNFLLEGVSKISGTVTEQALDCMTRLVNHDFDHNPWNYSGDLIYI